MDYTKDVLTSVRPKEAESALGETTAKCSKT